ncbi:Phenylacetate-CoA oxygenase, PaaJ subunit [Candidatus Hydrogenisulfobacillus filiaventi]|uniref:Phenylacetate-CoA oxygenase, PaaJ subunit n=1 Tax=Candidatus Hydrogenisulfobacillus filiaventi TaxID=2707344 RepID=A0A6F8ZJZ0_9FIRM|nr:phenylacetate-CoA oxygenase subunit PaaJ [Bacillota bacterium]CAB1130080.1 Phenylacetate-CoA oxygenase, PaaJ subunit [Candidatus Hydrogenisulfobacillus filiaventi]
MGRLPNPRRSGQEVEKAVWQALETVSDPEMPGVSIVALGMVESVRCRGTRVRVTLLPTYAACAGQAIMRQRAIAAIRRATNLEDVDVSWSLEALWSAEKVTPEGWRHLLNLGIGQTLNTPAEGQDVVACPYCGSTDTVLQSRFGPAACRSVYYCRHCRNPFEGLVNITRFFPAPATAGE